MQQLKCEPVKVAFLHLAACSSSCAIWGKKSCFVPGKHYLITWDRPKFMTLLKTGLGHHTLGFFMDNLSNISNFTKIRCQWENWTGFWVQFCDSGNFGLLNKNRGQSQRLNLIWKSLTFWSKLHPKKILVVMYPWSKHTVTWFFRTTHFRTT